MAREKSKYPKSISNEANQRTWSSKQRECQASFYRPEIKRPRLAPALPLRYRKSTIEGTAQQAKHNRLRLLTLLTSTSKLFA